MSKNYTYILLSTKWYWEEITKKKDGSVIYFYFILLICFTFVVAFVLVDDETDDEKLGHSGSGLHLAWAQNIWQDLWQIVPLPHILSQIN